MWKTFWIGTALALCGAVAVFGLCQSSTFLFRHPYRPDARVVIDSRTGAAVLVGFKGTPVADDEGAVDPGAVPRAEVPMPEHDFGVMNPLTMGHHEFAIINAGKAPLQLRIGHTTCKCTMVGLTKNKLDPGEQTTVRLEWNSGRDFHFEHSGTVHTNDPEQRSITLRIRGEVISELVADVAQVVVPPIAPDSFGMTDVLVYSQVFDRLEILRVECSLAGATCQITDFDPQNARDLKAKAVKCLRLKVPGDRPAGPFTGSIRLTAKLPNGKGQRHLELPVHGSVLPRMELIGGNVDPYGNIDFGSLVEGTGKRVTLLVKVRDIDPQIDEATITVFPDFLQATLRPHAGASGRGLYQLIVEVPKAAPVCQYRGHPRAEVRVDTGHPRIGEAALGVTFSVLPRAQL